MTRPPVRFTTTPPPLRPSPRLLLFSYGNLRAIRRPIQNRILALLDARQYKAKPHEDMLQRVAAEYYETLLEITPVTSFLARIWQRLTKSRNADIDQSRLFASIFKNDQPITTQLITITTCSPLLGRGSKTDAAPSKATPSKISNCWWELLSAHLADQQPTSQVQQPPSPTVADRLTEGGGVFSFSLRC